MPEPEAEEIDTVQRMMAAINRQEIVNAVLTLRVQQEVWRYVKGVLAVLGLAGGGALYYLMFVLPGQAADSAKQVLEDNLKQKLTALTAQQLEIDSTILTIEATEKNLRAGAAAANGQDADLKKALAGLSGDKDALTAQVQDLKAKLAGVKPQIDTLNNDEIKTAISELTGAQGQALKVFMRGLPKDALLLTAGACPDGWKELDAARGAVLVAQKPQAGPAQKAADWSVTLAADNVPAAQAVSLNYALTIPTVKLDIDKPAAGKQTFQLEACRHNCNAMQPFDQVAVVLSPTQGVAGNHSIAPVNLGEKKYGISVCRLR